MTSASGQAASYTVDDFVMVDTATEPALAADGRTLLFLSDQSGVRQVYAINVDGGDSAVPRRLTDTEGLVYHLTGRPGHAGAVFITDDGGDEQYQINLLRLEEDKAKAIASQPRVINTFGHWSPDGRLISVASNKRDQRFSDVYVLDVESGEERLVYEEDAPSIRAGAFSPSGRKLLYVKPKMELAGDNDLFLLDLDRGGAPVKITEHQGSAQWHTTLREAPDAFFLSEEFILARSDEGREFMGLQRIDLASGKRDFVLDPDWDVEALALSGDRKRVAVVVNEDGYSALAAYELNPDGSLGPALTLPAMPRGVVASPSWSADGRSLAFSFEGPLQASDVWLIDLEAEEARQMTHSSVSRLPREALAEPKLIRYKSFDGREIPAFFYRPRDDDGTRLLPCMVLVHGGPESQSRPALWGRYAAPAYLLAQREVCLLVPNVRGSTGYGKEYSHSDDVEKRMDSVADLLAAVDWLAASGKVDPDRIGVMGGSYGGFMTLAAITEAPDLWAAAIDMFGIANWETFMEHTGPWRRQQRAREYGSDPAFLRTISPIHKADQISTPLFVIQGDHDVRVPPEESEQIVDAVKRNEGVVEYAVFEREGHGIQRLPNRRRMNEMIVDFLREHLVNRES